MAEGATPFYYEFNNSGPGATLEGRRYTKPASKEIDIETVFGTDHAWIDSNY
jgi:pectinesterase